MPTRYRTRPAASRRHAPWGHGPLRPVSGQCFEIEVSPEQSGWAIRIPEIVADTRADTRASVEPAARRCIAEHTGIPIGYISVWTRD